MCLKFFKTKIIDQTHLSKIAQQVQYLKIKILNDFLTLSNDYLLYQSIFKLLFI